MGVRVKLSRNSTTYLPFWLAVLFYMAYSVVCVAVWIAAVTIRLLVFAAQAVQKKVRSFD